MCINCSKDVFPCVSLSKGVYINEVAERQSLRFVRLETEKHHFGFVVEPVRNRFTDLCKNLCNDSVLQR